LALLVLALVLIFGGNTPLTDSGEKINIATEFSDVPDFTIDKYVQKLEFTVTSPGSNIYINNDLLEVSNLESAKISVEDFKGTISLIEGRLTFDGTANRISVNDVAIKKEERVLKVRSADLSFAELSLSDFELDNIELISSGQLIVDQKGVFSLMDDSIQLKSFQGRLDYDNHLGLSGEVSQVKVSGMTLIK
jgi:hypothetical protein